MDLAAVHAELVEEIRNGLGYLVEPAPMAQLGDVFDTLAQQLEALGICHLLESADAELFRENLIRSGQSRRFFLRRSQSEGNTDDRHLALSWSRSFFDAIAAGDLRLARDIAQLSTAPWNASWEYEEDHCYMRLLHGIAEQPDPFPTPEAEALLERIEKALQGGESVRLTVMKALFARDAAEFTSALRDLLAAEEAANETDRSTPVLYWPRRNLSIEGLALLNIAELLGLRVAETLPLCPPAARLSFIDSPARDIFAEIEAMG